MRAAVLLGKEQVKVEQLEQAPLKAGEIRLAIEAALTCGTDLKVFRRGYHARMIVPPAVFGHELAGVISEVTPQAAGWQIGERVVVANSAPCDDCFFCRQGRQNLCENLLFLNGAYAESIVVPARLVKKNLLRLKPETGFNDAALCEPLACVVQGVEESGLGQGQQVLVIGSGPIGLMFARLASHLGCAVTLAGRGASRLEAARRLGAQRVVDVGAAGHTAKAVRAETCDRFDVVIEAVGRPETWVDAVQLAGKGGKVNFFGGCPAGTSVSLDTGLLHYSNLTLLSSFHHTPRAIRRALAFIEAGLIQAADFVDGECPLSGLPDLLRSMSQGNRAVKTLIRVRQ